MSATTPITQRDVAQACGVHPSTICLALKNSPSIPLETRRRIRAVADRLGYQPNVAARHLALRRTDKTPTGHTFPIAWINQEERRDHWRQDPAARPFLLGAQAQAATLGFRLEEFWTQEPGMATGRILQILRARGIEGVLLPVHRRCDDELLTPAWAEFALIGCNGVRLADWTDVYAPDHYVLTRELLRRLQQEGVRRVGLVLDPPTDAATLGLVHAAYSRHQVELAPGERIPAFWSDDATRVDAVEPGYGAWLREHRPDVVLGPDSGRMLSVRAVLRSRPVTIPPIDVGARDVGAAAVAAVAEKMRRFERGLSEVGRLHLVRAGKREVGLPAAVEGVA